MPSVSLLSNRFVCRHYASPPHSSFRTTACSYDSFSFLFSASSSSSLSPNDGPRFFSSHVRPRQRRQRRALAKKPSARPGSHLSPIMIRRRNAAAQHQNSTSSSSPSTHTTSDIRQMPMQSTSLHRENMARSDPSPQAAAVAAAEEEPVHNKSWNRQFQDIPIYPEILEYIREIGVGISPGQRKSFYLDQITQHATGDRRRFAKVVGGMATWTTPPRPKTKQDHVSPTNPAAAAAATHNNNHKSVGVPVKQHSQQSKPQPPQNPFEPPKPFGRHHFPVRIVGELEHHDQELPLFLDNLPQGQVPQVAICGRSNVGKSTLLNLLLYSNLAKEFAVRRQALLDEQERLSTAAKALKKKKRTPNTFLLPKGTKAATSHKPGETKKITFYQIGAPYTAPTTTPTTPSPSATGDHTRSQEPPPKKGNPPKKDIRMLLVDLPGYGFAYANWEQRDNFQLMMRRYLTGDLKNQTNKSILKRILLLLDARHGMLPADEEFLDMIQRTLLGHVAKALRLEQQEDDELEDDEDDDDDDDDNYNGKKRHRQNQRRRRRKQQEREETDEILEAILEEQEEGDDGGYLDEDDDDEEKESGFYGDDEDEDGDADQPKQGSGGSRGHRHRGRRGGSRRGGNGGGESKQDRLLRQRQETKEYRRQQKMKQRAMLKKYALPPIQIVLTKCDLVSQADLARRVVQVREQLSNALVREPHEVLPVMLVSSRTNHGVLELQKQLASMAAVVDPVPPGQYINETKPTQLPWGDTLPPLIKVPANKKKDAKDGKKKNKKRK